MERVCFQVELAHWFYEDFSRAKDTTLPKLSMEEFTQLSMRCVSFPPTISFYSDFVRALPWQCSSIVLF